ncbi:hypothetical protein HMPREF0682_1030 [Propionibacterium acidifaciens F0233]|uniref:Uncharacterized protein n=1 Tax=Propionibacterium acidifaciens F0233 TaxID=553198 RepID=U2S6K4_9ACTN|nr:hypothetical protein HMPREF0682_1030 [Propionibacterium acidifaciens F0233]
MVLIVRRPLCVLAARESPVRARFPRLDRPRLDRSHRVHLE